MVTGLARLAYTPCKSQHKTRWGGGSDRIQTLVSKALASHQVRGEQRASSWTVRCARVDRLSNSVWTVKLNSEYWQWRWMWLVLTLVATGRLLCCLGLIPQPTATTPQSLSREVTQFRQMALEYSIFLMSSLYLVSCTVLMFIVVSPVSNRQYQVLNEQNNSFNSPVQITLIGMFPVQYIATLMAHWHHALFR